MVYVNGAEFARPTLKPGQDQLARQNYYTTEAKDLEKTYLANNSFWPPEYYEHYVKNRRAEDYDDPQKPLMPPNPANKAGWMNTAHWRSTQQVNYSPEEIDGAVHHRQFGPPFEAVHMPKCVSDPNELSKNQMDFGQYGSDPRARLDPTETKLPNPKTELTIGTTKGTSHIPGYQGFLPTNTNNPKVAKIEQGEGIRTLDKNNLTEIYHQNLPGYAGHRPGNQRNDRGIFQVAAMSVFGADYSKNAGWSR